MWVFENTEIFLGFLFYFQLYLQLEVEDALEFHKVYLRYKNQSIKILSFAHTQFNKQKFCIKKYSKSVAKFCLNMH